MVSRLCELGQEFGHSLFLTNGLVLFSQILNVEVLNVKA